MTDRLDLLYRQMEHPIDHERLLAHLLAEVNTPWFNYKGPPNTERLTLRVVTACHQTLWNQRGREEKTVVTNLIKMSRVWDRQSTEMREGPGKHLLKWNAALIQSALIDAFA